MRTRDIAIAALERSSVAQDRNVTIHHNVLEQRAPTDESVKLLREMEAKAQAAVIRAVNVGNTTFECTVHQVHDHASDAMKWRAIFKLNGKQMIAEHTLNRYDVAQDPSHQKAWTALCGEIAKTIAVEVLHDAFVASLRTRWVGMTRSEADQDCARRLNEQIPWLQAATESKSIVDVRANLAIAIRLLEELSGRLMLRVEQTAP